MQVLSSLPRRVLGCRRGATAVEYGLIMALVILTMMTALIALADTTTGMWNNVSTAVQTAR